jgi:hypothetical protein
MALKTYDPKKYPIVFAGILVNEGLADGTFLNISTETPGFSSKSGVDGEVTRTRSHDRRATATITVMQTSEVNDRFSALYAADRAATNGQGVGAFYVQDLAGTTVLESSVAYIANDPDVTLEAEASTRDWVIELADYQPSHGSNSDE